MEDEVELNLGLSLGGCFRKFEKSEAAAAKSDLTSLSNSGDTHLDLEMDKREIQALRRQEARKKRDGKKRGRTAAQAFGGSAQNNEVGSESASKRINCEENDENHSEISQIQTPISTNSSSCSPSSMFPLQYHHFPPVQYVPFGNGFPFPYHMVPCWAAAAAGTVATPTVSGPAAEEKNVFHPVACRPCKNLEVQGREGQEQSGSSSAVSDTLNGMSSRETSHSVESKSEYQQVHASVKSNAEGQQSVHSDSSHQIEQPQGLVQENTHTDKIEASNNNQSTQEKAEEEPICAPNSAIQPVRKTSGDNNKPPKPQSKSPPPQPPLLRTQSLPQMPCVSTTGNGPNGKTINGFLYKYSRTEVSIMCVCHGNSFTPAEFVKHAGGTDVSHPLKHIVVIPSSFG